MGCDSHGRSYSKFTSTKRHRRRRQAGLQQRTDQLTRLGSAIITPPPAAKSRRNGRLLVAVSAGVSLEMIGIECLVCPRLCTRPLFTCSALLGNRIQRGAHIEIAEKTARCLCLYLVSKYICTSRLKAQTRYTGA